MPETSTTRRGMAVFLLLSMVVLGVFPLDVVLPSFPALAEHFQRTPSDIALSISLFAICISVSQLLIGPLSDRIGRKSLLLSGVAMSIAGAAGCVRSTYYLEFLLFRCMQAVGCGCFVLSQALIQDLFTGTQTAKGLRHCLPKPGVHRLLAHFSPCLCLPLFIHRRVALAVS